MDASLFIESIATIGLTSSLVVFFVWISWKREERLSARVTELEHQLTTTIMMALADNTKAMHEICEALRDVKEQLHTINHKVDGVSNNLDDRPCAMTGKKILRHLGVPEADES